MTKYIPAGADFLREKVIPALRNGSYEQAIGSLRENGNYCVLGVITDLHGDIWDLDSEWTMLGSLPRWIARDPINRDDCARMSLLDRTAVDIGITIDGDFDSGIDYEVDRRMQRFCSLVSMNDDGCDFGQIADAIERAIDPDDLFQFEKPDSVIEKESSGEY